MTLSDVEHGSSSALSASGIRAGYLDGFVPRLPVDLAGRSESELEFDGPGRGRGRQIYRHRCGRRKFGCSLSLRAGV